MLDLTAGLSLSPADVSGVLGVGGDGQRVYFVAGGGFGDLYLWDAGDLKRVSASPGFPTWSRQYSNVFRKQSRITPDGRYLLMVSSQELTEDVTNGTSQVYRYDAGADALTCVSCLPTAAGSTGSSTFAVSQLGATATQRAYLPRAITDDGDRVFFETDQSMVRQDSNGVIDVYMWNRDGVHLISSGSGRDDAHFLDAGSTGDEVFFVARDRLVQEDADTNLDVYVASVGGGSPELADAPRPCEGDRCQGPLGGDAEDVVPGTMLLREPKLDRRASLALRPLGRAGRARLAAGKRVFLTARVNRPGRVSVLGRAMIDGRPKVMLRASRVTGRPGDVQVRLRLSRVGREHLADHRGLAVVLTVRFPGAETRRLRLHLTGAGRTDR